MKFKLSLLILITTLICNNLIAYGSAGSQPIQYGVPVEVPVLITTEPNQLMQTSDDYFSVTVPASLPVSIDSQGRIVTASDAMIVNNSDKTIVVSSVQLQTIHSSGWDIVSYDEDFSSMIPGTKTVGFLINNTKSNEINGLNFNPLDWPLINPYQSFQINYDIRLPIQIDTLNNEAIARIIFVINSL